MSVTTGKLTVHGWLFAAAIVAALVVSAPGPAGAQEMSSANYKVKTCTAYGSGGSSVATTTTTQIVDSSFNGFPISVAANSASGFPSAGLILIGYNAADPKTGLDPLPYTTRTDSSFTLAPGAVATGMSYPLGARVSLYMSASANYASAIFVGQFVGSASVGQGCTAADNDLVMSSANYSNVSGYAHVLALGKAFNVYRIQVTGGTTYNSYTNAMGAVVIGDVVRPIDNLIWYENVTFRAATNSVVLQQATLCGTVNGSATSTGEMLRNCVILGGNAVGGSTPVDYVHNCTVVGANITGGAAGAKNCITVTSGTISPVDPSNIAGYASSNFASSTTNDYHLAAGAALAIDSPVSEDLGDEAAYADIDGNPRGLGTRWDIGADEYASGMAAQWVYPLGEAMGPISCFVYNIQSDRNCFYVVTSSGGTIRNNQVVVIGASGATAGQWLRSYSAPGSIIYAFEQYREGGVDYLWGVIDMDSNGAGDTIFCLIDNGTTLTPNLSFGVNGFKRAGPGPIERLHILTEGASLNANRRIYFVSANTDEAICGEFDGGAETAWSNALFKIRADTGAFEWRQISHQYDYRAMMSAAGGYLICGLTNDAESPPAPTPSTTTTAQVIPGAVTVPVSSTVGFPVSGTAFLLSGNTLDAFTYTGTTGAFTGVSGVDYTHAIGARVSLNPAAPYGRTATVARVSTSGTVLQYQFLGKSSSTFPTGDRTRSNPYGGVLKTATVNAPLYIAPAGENASAGYVYKLFAGNLSYNSTPTSGIWGQPTDLGFGAHSRNLGAQASNRPVALVYRSCIMGSVGTPTGSTTQVFKILDSNGEANTGAVQTTTTAAVGTSSTTIYVASTTGFAGSGTAYIEGDNFTYTGVTATTFTGVLLISSAHVSGVAVAQGVADTDWPVTVTGTVSTLITWIPTTNPATSRLYFGTDTGCCYVLRCDDDLDPGDDGNFNVPTGAPYRVPGAKITFMKFTSTQVVFSTDTGRMYAFPR